MAHAINRLIVIPLFPQQAAATTGSIFSHLSKVLKKYLSFPPVEFITQYPLASKMIEAFCDSAHSISIMDYDHVLFSFHGLPKRHIQKADRNGCCLKSGCCNNLHSGNYPCYSAQCHATARAIVERLQMPSEKYTICFQSRLGKEPWIQPYASQVLHDLAKRGYKKIAILSPSFVCDCLETLFEIQEEYALEFQKAGGEKLTLVPGLNDHPLWIEALSELIATKTSSFT